MIFSHKILVHFDAKKEIKKPFRNPPEGLSILIANS